MQPTPPCALKPSAVASSPDSWMKSAPQEARCIDDALDLAGGVLDADDPRQFGQRAHRLGRHVHDRPAGDVVDDDRQLAAVMQRGVMRDQAGLRRLVVIGRHDQRGIGADLFGVAHQADAFDGVVRPGACDHRHAACDGGRRPLRSPSDARHGSASGFRRWSPPERSRASLRRCASPQVSSASPDPARRS